jgi:chemotaxis protein histidine kinase CheA
MDDSDDIVKEFLVESHENLDRLDRDLVDLEKHPSDREILASIFRTIHTIKGTSGFLGFGKLEAVTHVGESLLARLRDGQLSLHPELTSALLAMVDAVRQMLAKIEQAGGEGERDDQELIANLTRLLQLDAPPSSQSSPNATPVNPEAPDSVAPAASLGDILINRGVATVHDVSEAVARQSAGDPRRVGEILVDQGAVKPQDVLAALHVQQAGHGQAASESTIRVDVGLLDQLMNLVGELVLARNQILQFTKTTEESSLVTAGQRLNLIASELQESVMKTRMQPIGSVWSRFPRTVRDVALACGKQVRIQMQGQETELDKTLIEAIKDPMTHLVRNAVDHGIEHPDVREAAGKDREGVLLLRAYHEGGQVNIEISDDGAGLNLEKVVQKAVQKGLIGADQAARLNEREAANLVFLPGLSTAEKVTNVSGRGVGMDVVKTNIERIGGTVDVQSATGKGTTVKVKIPLTLAIVPALIVTSGGDRFAIPQVALTELVSIDARQSKGGIETVQGAPVYRLRGRLLPLVYLNRELGQAETGNAGASPERKHNTLDFAQARLKHLQWVGRLQQVLDGRTTITLEEAGSHERCALGTWLYGSGMKNYGGLKEMKLLESAHKHFHGLVREVVAHKLKGDTGGADREFAQVGPASQAIVELLLVAERKLQERTNVNIVVLHAEGRQFGLVVDDINDTEEIVVKPLRKQLKSVKVFAGATIMGDGRIALILDVLGLAQRAHVIGEARDAASQQEASAQQVRETRQTLLLFQTGADGRMAIPLSSVARLEEFQRGAIERSGRQEVVQYRGHILPLIHVAEVVECGSQAGSGAAAETGAHGPLQVIVYTEQARSIGLVVDHILDVVEENLVVERPGRRSGVLGSALIQQRVTDLLDVEGVVRAVEPGFFEKGAGA